MLIPLMYTFVPRAQYGADAQPDPSKDEGLGYYIIEPQETPHILSIFTADGDRTAIDTPVPQWPYIFTQLMVEVEADVQKQHYKLELLINLMLHKKEHKQTFERFACGKNRSRVEDETVRIH